MPEVEIVLPKLHPKQLIAYNSEATDLLFGGATRGGKSYFVRHALIKWCSQIPGLQCDMFRLYEDDIIKEAMLSETGFHALLAPWVKAGLCKITQTEIQFWNGSAIFLCHCSDDKVMLKHQGIGRHVRVFVEATQIAERRIRWLSAWVTMSEEMKSRVPEKWKGQFPKIIHVTNPIGVSAPYYKREYVKARKPYEIGIVGDKKRQYIPALVEDNPSENAETTKARVLNMGDEAIGRALLEADWDAITGEFFPEWSEKRHVVADCHPPPHWYRYRAYDWGTADPSACIYVGISDGEPFTDENGRKRWFPRGALLVYNELYFCDKNDPAKGARMRNEDMARAILENSEYEHRNVVTLTDSKPFQDMGGVSIAQSFATQGVNLSMADTSRIPGWSQLRGRLIGKVIDTFSPRVPMIFFCERCTYCRDYVPALTRHKSESKVEDATESGEATHICLSAGTMVRTPFGPKAIESLVAGDEVVAGDGVARKISGAGLTRQQTAVIRLVFSDGSAVTCTPDHKILTEVGWIKACDAMRYAGIVGVCESASFQKTFKSLTANNFTSIEEKSISFAGKSDCIEWYGNTLTARFRKACTFITSTITDTIIRSRIFSYYAGESISATMPAYRRESLLLASPLKPQLPRLPNGIKAQRVGSGTKSTIENAARPYIDALLGNVITVLRNLARMPRVYFAPTTANQRRAERAASILSLARVRDVLRNLWLTSTQRSYSVRSIVAVEPAGTADVYCLTEPITHSFQLANGLVVRNCDAIRYACQAHSHNVIKDRLEPMEGIVRRALSERNTIRDITDGMI